MLPWLSSILATIGLALTSSAGWAQVQPARNPLSADVLADLIAEASVLAAGDFETTFELVHLGRRPSSIDGPWDETAPEALVRCTIS